jgi:tetratricopeptide (TPR) repeat protein
LTRPFDTHLDNDELDRLVALQRASVSGSEQLSEPALREAQRHVESCQDCSRRLQRHQFVHSEILRMRLPNPSLSTPQCIGYAEWLEVAAGLLPEAKIRERMKHAAQCGHCGPLLKNAAETIADEVTPSEEALLASLRSARPEWRKNMAATLRDSVRDRQQKGPRWRALFAWPTPAYAFAGIVAVAIVAWIGLRTLGPPSVEQLLAQAYTEHRTLEVRIPGARYAPMQAQRGTGQSDFDKPQSLLRAEALISENLRKNPSDALWLQDRARADLLNGNYDSAIKSLQRALETQPDSPSLLTDLGSAYFVRGESAHRPIDYGNAIESLGKALGKSPDDPVALFNHALACERLFLYTQAIDDWEHYLRVDPQSDWADDARKRRASIQEKLQKHSQTISEPLLTPTTIADGGIDQTIEDEIDARAEDYLDAAVRDWLPAAFPTDPRAVDDKTAKIRLSLRTLATILISRHQDEWLADILSASYSRDLAAGLQALSIARKDNAAGDPEIAEFQAQKAVALFQKAGSAAGIWRAELEEIYASQRRFHSEACLLAVTRLRDHVGNKKVAFISIQLHLEHYACLTSAHVLFDKATDALSSAVALSKEARYPILYLRALGFLASEQTEKGDAEAAWELDCAGLGEYWLGFAGPRRASQFYDDMGVSAQESGQWLLSVALDREAVVAISATPDRSAEGMERLELASSASHAHLWRQAALEYSRALDSFSKLPRNESIRAFEGSSEVGLAEAAIAQGHFQEATSHLLSAHSKLPADFEEYETWLYFYKTLASLRRNTGDVTGSAAACASAIQVAEMGLHGIRDELGRLRWNRATGDCYRETVDFRLELGDANGALEFWEWYRSAGTRAKESNAAKKLRFSDLEHEANLPRLRGVENELSTLNAETVITYADLKDQTVAWSYDDRGIVWKAIDIPTGFKGIVARFGEECRDPKSDAVALRKDGQAIFNVLLAPFSEQLDAHRTLVLETDGITSFVPFAALVDADGKYVSERYRIAYLPAFGYREMLRPSQTISPQDEAIVVGSPALVPAQGPYPNLPDADREAWEVAGYFTHAVYLPGEEATLDAVLAALPRSAVFHFAGHSIAKPGHMGLLLAQPESSRSGILDSESLAHAKTQHLKLAVLSACSTTQDDDEATGAGSVARAFLRTGVPDVVATDWPIDSSSTAIFMRYLYRDLLRGDTVAEALRQAMHQMQTNSQYKHPYYWAAFEVFGRGADAGSTQTTLSANRIHTYFRALKGISAADSFSN